LPGVEVVNRGVGGDTLESGRRRFEREVLALRPQVLVIELGANDFHSGERSIEELRADLEHMVRAAREASCKAIIAGVFGPQLDPEGHIIEKRYPEGDPERGRQILHMERAVAAAHGCAHIENIQADLNAPEHWANERHPNGQGNRLVAARTLPVVRSLLRTGDR
jgi:lysophospholipase L1-like esterase